MIEKHTDVFDKWFSKLALNVQKTISDYIGRVIDGNFSNLKPVGQGVQEITVDFQKGYRIYCIILNNKTLLMLLCGGNKSGNQKYQQEDIKRAIGMKNYLKRSGQI